MAWVRLDVGKKNFHPGAVEFKEKKTERWVQVGLIPSLRPEFLGGIPHRAKSLDEDCIVFGQVVKDKENK